MAGLTSCSYLGVSAQGLAYSVDQRLLRVFKLCLNIISVRNRYASRDGRKKGMLTGFPPELLSRKTWACVCRERIMVDRYGFFSLQALLARAHIFASTIL